LAALRTWEPADDGKPVLVALWRRPKGARKTWSVVDTDNFGGDYPNERFVAQGIAHESDANLMADALNAQAGEHSLRFYMVVDDAYELQPGFEP